MSFGHFNDLPDTPSGLKERIKEFAGALENLPKAFRLLWEADPSSTLGMGLATLIGAALPISQAWVTKLIIDGVLRALKNGRSGRQGLEDLLPYLLLEFGLLFAGSAVSQFRQLIEELIDHRLGHLINTRIIRKALSLDARHFEDAEFYDKM